MTKRKPQGESTKRRSHSSIDALPTKLRNFVERMIINNEWPKDFKKHYNGTPRHCDITSYCRTKGCRISKSAIGRFAQQIQKVSAQKIAGDFQNYARAHLGTLCLVYANIQSDLEISTIDSDRREVLERQQEKNITRIEQLIVSLRKLDGSCPNSIQGG